jgi:hypothetical protein
VRYPFDALSSEDVTLLPMNFGAFSSVMNLHAA